MSDALVIDRVERRLGKRLVLAGASHTFAGPGTLVVRGENGAGKSTLLRVVAGVLDADAGDVRIAGASVLRERVRALRALGYAPESPELPDRLTAGELLALTRALRAGASSADCVDELGVRPLLDRPLGALSLGQRRRVLVAAAMADDPAVVALDEPTNGLDVDAVAVLAGLLRKRVDRGLANVVATHDTAFAAAVASETAVLVEGKLCGQLGRA